MSKVKNITKLIRFACETKITHAEFKVFSVWILDKKEYNIRAEVMSERVGMKPQSVCRVFRKLTELSILQKEKINDRIVNYYLNPLLEEDIESNVELEEIVKKFNNGFYNLEIEPIKKRQKNNKKQETEENQEEQSQEDNEIENYEETEENQEDESFPIILNLENYNTNPF